MNQRKATAMTTVGLFGIGLIFLFQNFVGGTDPDHNLLEVNSILVAKDDELKKITREQRLLIEKMDLEESRLNSHRDRLGMELQMIKNGLVKTIRDGKQKEASQQYILKMGELHVQVEEIDCESCSSSQSTYKKHLLVLIELHQKELDIRSYQESLRQKVAHASLDL